MNGSAAVPDEIAHAVTSTLQIELVRSAVFFIEEQKR